MSFDLAVWRTDVGTPSDADAGKTYVELSELPCDGGPMVPEVGDFYAEFTQRYQEIDDFPEEEVDDCPWSVALCHSKKYIIVSVVWSRADEMRSVVLDLAKKYQLLLFDPQSDKVIWSPHTAATGRPH